MADSEWVWIRHPDIPDGKPSRQPRAAFDENWSELGWYIVPDEVGLISGVLNKPIDDLNSLTKEELATAAARTGIVVDQKASKAELAAAVSAAATTEEGEA